MKNRHLLLLLLLLSLVSWRDLNERIPQINRNSSSYEMRKKTRIDHFDFSGEFQNLDRIDIDGRRLKDVKIDLTGVYPLLESITFESSFGELEGRLTGHFLTLKEINFLCGSTAVKLDCSGGFDQPCTVHLLSKGDIYLKLPQNVSVVAYTKTVTGRVKTPLKKKGWGILNKTFVNSLYDESLPPHLTLHIETNAGTIILE